MSHRNYPVGMTIEQNCSSGCRLHGIFRIRDVPNMNMSLCSKEGRLGEAVVICHASKIMEKMSERVFVLS